MSKPLEGVRVIDFSRWVAGPVSTLLLSDLGAEVIKVENTGGNDERRLAPFLPDGDTVSLLLWSRGKKFMTLSMRCPEAQQIVDRLVGCSDVVVHNYLPQTREAKMLDYERLRQINPHIIESAISGFGQDGPYAQRPAFDTMAQAMSGSMSYTGFPENPPTRSQVAWVDCSTAFLNAFAVMVALYNRDKTGEGQYIDVSLLDTGVFMAAGMGVAADCQLNGIVRHQLGNQSWYNATNCYKAKDGWLMICAMPDRPWGKMCRLLGKEEWADDLRFKDAVSMFEHRDLLNPAIAEWVSEKTVKEAEQILWENHVPCGPVYHIDQVISDEQVRFRKMLVNINYRGGGTALGGNFPVKFSDISAEAGGTVFDPGAHNQEIYVGLLGLTQEELLRLQTDKVV